MQGTDKNEIVKKEIEKMSEDEKEIMRNVIVEFFSEMAIKEMKDENIG